MANKQKAKWEVALKEILYFVEEPEEQNRMVEVLKKYNDQLPDSKLRDGLQKLILNAKKDYYDKVDYLIDDILHGGKSENDRNRIITDLLNEIKPTVEKAERTMWDKICDLFKWS